MFSALAGSFALASIFSSCYDPANQVVDNKNPGALDMEALRANKVSYLDAQPLQNPGKIYVRDNMLYVNDKGKGLHIIDNSDMANPQAVGFFNIPGNIDVAMKDNALYADSYMDLLVINMDSKKEVRIPGVFEQFPDGSPLAQNIGPNGSFTDVTLQAVTSSTPGSGTGRGGSLARFAIVDNSLYVLDGQMMRVFNIEDPYEPKKLAEMKMDFIVETIFPHQEKLFIGGTQGMYVYDNSDPTAPVQLGKIEHVAACDPVVVQGDFAYVTLRKGQPCSGAAADELLVVDVKDPKNMSILHKFPMYNPHGLAVRGNHLFICDGDQGLKIYDLEKKEDILNNMLSRDASLAGAYDVIAMEENPAIIVVAKNGIFQYDVSDAKAPVRISEIKVGV